MSAFSAEEHQYESDDPWTIQLGLAYKWQGSSSIAHENHVWALGVCK